MIHWHNTFHHLADGVYYLRLGEVHVHAPLDKVLLGCVQAPHVCLLTVHPDQLLSKVLREELRHLAGVTVSRATN